MTTTQEFILYFASYVAGLRSSYPRLFELAFSNILGVYIIHLCVGLGWQPLTMRTKEPIRKCFDRCFFFEGITLLILSRKALHSIHC